MSKELIILGIRGVPAQHGGFETFAERLALHLVQAGWRVTVYCQEEGEGRTSESFWQGIRRVHIAVPGSGALSSVIFDLKVAWHCTSRSAVLLTLGYNTAIFNAVQRIRGQRNLINMDGIEWQRVKWGVAAKLWFRFNELAGARVGNHLVADHPAIKTHLQRLVPESKITMIPYGADEPDPGSLASLESLGLVSGRFSTIIARPEPENSILEMVAAFSQKHRGHKLVVLGKFSPAVNAYHRKVIGAASQEVIFPGAIYDRDTVWALRMHGKLYLHGHTVGGTNPSLVEALGARSAILAHDNKYNRWVAGASAAYFSNSQECAAELDRLLENEETLNSMKLGSYKRFKECFTWTSVLRQYQDLLEQWLPSPAVEDRAASPSDEAGLSRSEH